MASAYGAAFHFLIGGSIGRLFIYLLVAWVGFIAGHLLGDMLSFHTFQLGALNLLSASIGSWAALMVSWWLVRRAT